MKTTERLLLFSPLFVSLPLPPPPLTSSLSPSFNTHTQVKPLHPGGDIEIYTRNFDSEPLTWFPARLLMWRGGDTYNIRYKGDPEDEPANEFDGQIDPWRQRASLSKNDSLLLPLSSFSTTTTTKKKSTTTNKSSKSSKSNKSNKRKVEEKEEEWVAARVVKTTTATQGLVRMDRTTRDIPLDTRYGVWRMDESKSGRKRRRR